MTNAEARFNNSLRPRKPGGSLGRTAQDVHLDSHTAPDYSICSTPLYSWSFVRFTYTQYFTYFTLSWLVFCEVSLPQYLPVPRSYIWSFVRFLCPSTPPISRSRCWSLVRFNSLPQYFTYFTLLWLVFCEVSLPQYYTYPTLL